MPGKISAWLLDLFFPLKCPFCRRVLRDGEDGPCGRCQQSLPWTSPDDELKECPGVSRCESPLWYRDQVRESFHRYKFSGTTVYARTYGALMAQCVRDRLAGEYDVIVWTPLSKKRLRRRGYDQSFLLARAMGEELGAAPVAALRKVRDTAAQSSLEDAAQRRANVEGAYEVTDPSLVAGRRVLLVDDVVTTGSTLSQAARALWDAGAVGVVAVTFARARG